MATKSFLTEYKFTTKSGHKLINAIDNSRRVDHTIKQRVSEVTHPEEINSILKSFKGKK